MAAEVAVTRVGSALQAVHSEYSAWPVGIEKAVRWEVRGHQVQVKRVRRAALMAQQARVLAVARVARSALRAQSERQVAPAGARCSLSETTAQYTPAGCSARPERRR